ncbi:type 1 glutamine amidotransferase domain-containing protein [bacterium]|nr:type 1 glutamine amidotransferase domain-containing protein [bacterium]
MSATLDILNPTQPKRVLIIAANTAVSKQTGWPIGFWAGELTHPYWEFTEAGYVVDIASPDGGDLMVDGYSDPRDPSGYSADDLISLGFLTSPKHVALLKETQSLQESSWQDYDAIFLVGGQSPMYTFIDNEPLHQFVADAYAAGKVVAVVCHATCILLKVKDDAGRLLVDGKMWTGFADSEEQFADSFVNMRIQPFWIESEARKLPNTNFVVSGRFKSFAVRDGHLITGQQQYSGAAAARLVIQALGL